MNSKGTYIGVILVTDNWPKHTYTKQYRGCPSCGKRSVYNNEQYCAMCGDKLVWKKEVIEQDFDMGYYNPVLVDRLYKLPVRAIYKTGKQYLVSNVRDNTSISVEDCDYDCCDLSGITPQTIETMKANFINTHSDDITLLESKGIKCDVVFGVVPWREF